MKQSILFFLFSFTMMSNLSSQMLQIGDTWIYETTILGGSSYTETFDSITLVSDTVINGLQYYKLVATDDPPCLIYNEVEYLREVDNKIYRLEEDMGFDRLMIDFSEQESYPMIYDSGWTMDTVTTLVTNDSIGVELLPSGQQIEVVYQSIMNNQSFTDDGGFKLSKELGYFRGGLLFPGIGTGLCDPIKSSYLRCKISGSDTIRLTELDCYESSIILSTTEINIDEELLFPNPTQGAININGDYEILSISDESGKVYANTITMNKGDVSHLPKGVYFVSMRRLSDDRIITQQILKL